MDRDIVQSLYDIAALHGIPTSAVEAIEELLQEAWDGGGSDVLDDLRNYDGD